MVNETLNQKDEKPVEEEKQPRRKRGWLVILLGLMALLLMAGIGSVSGYLTGIGMRRNAESTQMAAAALEQYQMALDDITQGYYDRARQRLEYVIQVNPNHPEAVARLSDVLLALNTTATPTIIPTPTLSPTPDLRGVQELYDQAQQAILDSSWESAIQSLLNLRKADPEFKPVDVDGMLFLALRNRGKVKILSKDLEGGIYDLTLAERFGPLDTEAKGLLNGATQYITGASFWEIDWAQVVNYFSQVAIQYPGLMDGSGMTSVERYRLGLYEYGNWLAASGKACKAVEAYTQSLEIGYDGIVEQAGIAAANACAAGQPKETPTP